MPDHDDEPGPPAEPRRDSDKDPAVTAAGDPPPGEADRGGRTGADDIVPSGEAEVDLGTDAGPLLRTDAQPEKARDQVRAIIAYALLGLLAVIVLTSAAMLLIAWGKDDASERIEDLVEVLQVVLPPVVAVVGSVTGFYYGSQDRPRK